MNYEWFIAKRLLQSQRHGGLLSFITSFSILGITLGTAALIIALSVLSGFEREIKDKVIAFVTHIQVQGLHGGAIPYDPQRIATIKSEIRDIESISPYVAREAMIRSKSGVDGIYLKGLEAGKEHKSLKRYITEGAFLSVQNGPKQLVVGKKLATKLAIGLGDSVIVFGVSGKSSGELTPRVMKLYVTGIYESGMSDYDDIYAFTSLDNTQQLFNLDGKITGFDVSLLNIENVNDVAEQLNEKLGYPYMARTMFYLYRNLFSWVELQKELSPLLLVLILIVATINIFGTLLMFVVEKVEAIGILGAVGSSPGSVQKVFFYQGMLISLLGIICGNILGFTVCFLQQQFSILSLPSDIYFMSSVPVKLELFNFVIVSAGAFILALLTTLLPSRAAAKIDPIAVIRFS